MIWVILAIVVILVLGGVWFVATHNKLVSGRNTIQEAWRQIDVELNRRYDLIPNLVETVKGYASHEQATLTQITQLRTQAATLARMPGADAAQRAQVEDALSGQLHQLMVNVEAYPDLKANQNFVELQRQLVDTEDRIAAGRRYYNARVREYNTKIESMPSNIVAGAYHFEKAGYFEVTDQNARQVPTVNFGSSAPGVGAVPTGGTVLPEATPDPALPPVSNPSQDQPRG